MKDYLKYFKENPIEGLAFAIIGFATGFYLLEKIKDLF